MTLKRYDSTLAILALAALTGCGETDHTLGDDSNLLSGAGTSSSGGTSSGGSSGSQEGGSSSLPQGDAGPDGDEGGVGGADAAPSGGCGVDSASCVAGSECFRDFGAGEGTCAPLCDSNEQSAWGQPCTNGIDGEEGVCRPFLRVSDEGLVPTGVCTNECDPLSQQCPSGFSCDLTESFAGQEPPKTFACLPVVKALPGQAGEACDGWPRGTCAPGLNCIQEASSYVCRTFCDTSVSGGCSNGESCTKPEWFPAELNVGVCAP